MMRGRRLGLGFVGPLMGALILLASAASVAVAAPLKVACTGTSAMQGLGSSAGHHVPDEMGRALGSGFTVQNFAVEGATAIKSVSTSYTATSQYKSALAANPDIVVFWFGGNDSFAGTWNAHKSEFQADYTSLVKSFQALPSHPRTFLVRLWAFVDTPVQRSVLDKEILPIIDKVAADTGSVLIDYRKAFAMHPEYFPDGMHPNDAGTLQIGKLFAMAVTDALAGGADGGVGSDAGAAGDAGPAPMDSAAETVTEPPMTGTGGSAGTGGTSGGGSGGATPTPPPPTTGTGGAPTVGATSDGGGCAIAAANSAPMGALGSLMLLMTLGLLRAPRKRRP